jgi:hypothetical protein
MVEKGVVTFPKLSFSIAGNFTLRFRILNDDSDDDESYDAAVRGSMRDHEPARLLLAAGGWRLALAAGAGGLHWRLALGLALAAGAGAGGLRWRL